MKFAILGDVHLRKANPINRIDNYADEQLRKFQFASEYARDNYCQGILQPGDLFDSHNIPYEITERYMRCLLDQTFPIPMHCCLGQHDQRYHKQSTRNTPIGCLFAGIERIGSTLLGSIPKVIVEQYSKTEIHIYGSSWGEEIPTIQNESAINILVTHRMVTKDGPLWEGQEGNVEAKDLLKQTKFRLIVCGDNHQHFYETYRMRHLVNCGSLMRSNISQVDHKPVFYVYDTETNKVEKHEIPIKPSEEVFALERFVEEKNNKAQLEEFVKTLADTSEHGLSFKDNLFAHMADEDFDPGVKSILEEVMEAI